MADGLLRPLASVLRPLALVVHVLALLVHDLASAVDASSRGALPRRRDRACVRLRVRVRYRGWHIVYSLGSFVFGGNSNPPDKDAIISQQHFTYRVDRIAPAGFRIIPIASPAWRATTTVAR